MPIRWLIPNYRNLITNDPLTALLNLSADLEFTLSTKLYFEKRVPLEKMETWTLGTLIHECTRNHFFDDNQIGLLNDFLELRNKVVHWRGLLNSIRQDPLAKLRLEAMLTKLYDFVEKIEAKYHSDQDSERKYGEAFKKGEIWIAKFLKQENPRYN